MVAVDVAGINMASLLQFRIRRRGYEPITRRRGGGGGGAGVRAGDVRGGGARAGRVRGARRPPHGEGPPASLKLVVHVVQARHGLRHRRGLQDGQSLLRPRQELYVTASTSIDWIEH